MQTELAEWADNPLRDLFFEDSFLTEPATLTKYVKKPVEVVVVMPKVLQ